MSLIHELEPRTEGADKIASMTNSPIKVLIVDDHPGVRAGLKNLIGGANDIVVMGEGANGADAIHLIDTKKK